MSQGAKPAWQIRLATRADLPAIQALMSVSIRELLGACLSPPQVEASFEIMGLDTALIDDGSYFAVEHAGALVGCGGWSRRATLFGGDHSDGRDGRLLDPAAEPARIRAMYTHPACARRGVGRLVLAHCEDAAIGAGFRKLSLVATLAGEPLYRAAGYAVVDRINVPTSRGIAVPCANMRKELPD